MMKWSDFVDRIMNERVACILLLVQICVNMLNMHVIFPVNYATPQILFLELFCCIVCS